MTVEFAEQSRKDTSPSMMVCNRTQTAEALGFNALMEAIAVVAREYQAGGIVSPERMVVQLGAGGVLLSMPATACDIGIHKLVNVVPSNKTRNMPTIHGIVTVYDATTGRPLCQLDGPEVTGRRTAAVTLLAIRHLLSAEPKEVLLIGTGTQAAYHIKGLHTIFPECKIWVRGVTLSSANAFCEAQRAIHAETWPCEQCIPNVQVVVTLTTSTRVVYNEAAKTGRLVIGVGAFKPEMAELGKLTLDGSDLFADDPVGARHEAGDLMQAGIDWKRVKSLACILNGDVDLSRPLVFKSVGTGAWDLAASRVALKSLGISTTA